MPDDYTTETTDEDGRPWQPIGMPRVASDLVYYEQWLADIGLRDIVAKLASADASEFVNGARELKEFFVTAIAAAREDEREHLGGGMVPLLVGVIFGAAAASVLWWAFG